MKSSPTFRGIRAIANLYLLLLLIVIVLFFPKTHPILISFAGVTGLTFCLLLANFGLSFFRFIIVAFHSLLGYEYSFNKQDFEIACYGKRYALGSGAVLFSITIIYALMDITSPHKFVSGVATTIAIIGYAAFLSQIVFGYLANSIEQQLPVGKKALITSPLNIRSALIPVIFVYYMLLTFFILLLTFSS